MVNPLQEVVAGALFRPGGFILFFRILMFISKVVATL
jgi:hypothetical protein